MISLCLSSSVFVDLTLKRELIISSPHSQFVPISVIRSNELWVSFGSSFCAASIVPICSNEFGVINNKKTLMRQSGL